jgi:hypothetical protein
MQKRSQKLLKPRLTFGRFGAKWVIVENQYETNQIQKTVEEAGSQSRSTLL